MQRHAPLVLSTIMAIGLALALVPLPPTSAAVAAPTEVRAAGVRADVDPIPDGITRLSGASRYETAVAVAQRHLPGVPVAFVASGADFPDALAAASAAALAGGPLLLTSPSSVPGVVLDELQRLRPARIALIGGAGAVTPGVQQTLERHRSDRAHGRCRPLRHRARDHQVGVHRRRPRGHRDGAHLPGCARRNRRGRLPARADRARRRNTEPP